MKRTFILVIMDGWGIGPSNEANPIYIANPPNIAYIQNNFPAGALQASGIAVGLPWEEEGNSEVGHLTIGAGKILYQHYPRITMAIDDGSFFKNPALVQAFAHARENKSAVHLIGVLTDGNVHASFKHLASLIEMAKKEECQELYLQLFSDGKDSTPRSAPNLLKKLNAEIEKNETGVLASLTGRYYGLDRDSHWDRTEIAYKILLGQAGEKNTPENAVANAYGRNLTEEFVAPTIVSFHPIKENDALIFFDFREDSIRQIVETFIEPDFNKFPIQKFNNLYVATMTEYRADFKVAVAFPPETINKPLGLVLAENQKTQLRIAETNKYAHVTYFFNGLKEEPFKNEYRVLVPSKTAVHIDDYPEMMAEAVTDRVLTALNEGGFDFILVNYANPDLIAHTGNFKATVKAISTVDREIGRLVKSVLAHDHVAIITSDHGNAEVLINMETGEPEMKHDISPVPFYLVGQAFQKRQSEEYLVHLPQIGILSDVAPTLLNLMDLPVPREMTGQNLLDQLL